MSKPSEEPCDYYHMPRDRILTIDVRTAFDSSRPVLRRWAKKKPFDKIDQADIVDPSATHMHHHVEITDGVRTRVLKGRLRDTVKGSEPWLYPERYNFDPPPNC